MKTKLKMVSAPLTFSKLPIYKLTKQDLKFIIKLDPFDPPGEIQFSVSLI